jgi:hypothetical protein
MTIEQLDKAGSKLAESDRGLQAMRDLLAFLENGAVGLDDDNQAALMAILNGAWGEYAGTALDVLRDKTGAP